MSMYISFFLNFNASGKPDLPEQLGCLTRECLQGNKEFLLDELEPIDICDLLLEERAIEIMTHDRITETGERREQIKNLLQTMQQNENDCFHYFLYIIEKNEFNYIRNVLESPSASEAVRDGMFNLMISINLGLCLLSRTIFKYSSF